jgi:hypothetical protein
MNMLSRSVIGLSIGVALFCAFGSASSDDRLVFTDDDLRDYMNRWLRRDGLAGHYISDYFLEYLGLHAERFLEIMSERPEVYESWIQELPDHSFVDYGGCIDTAHLSCQKTSLIQVLESKPVQGRAEALRLKLLARLREVTVTSAY